MPVMILIFLAVFVIIAIKIGARGLDDDRIRSYIGARGGRLVSKRWVPFGKGWLGEKNARIYEIKYVDREGDLHTAMCKTSAMSGVYLSDDRVIQQSVGGFYGGYKGQGGAAGVTREPVRRSATAAVRGVEAVDTRGSSRTREYEGPGETAKEQRGGSPEVVYREDPKREAYVRKLENENAVLRGEVERLREEMARQREEAKRGREDETRRGGEGRHYGEGKDRGGRDAEGFLRE